MRMYLVADDDRLGSLAVAGTERQIEKLMRGLSHEFRCPVDSLLAMCHGPMPREQVDEQHPHAQFTSDREAGLA